MSRDNQYDLEFFEWPEKIVRDPMLLRYMRLDEMKVKFSAAGMLNGIAVSLWDTVDHIKIQKYDELPGLKTISADFSKNRITCIGLKVVKSQGPHFPQNYQGIRLYSGGEKQTLIYEQDESDGSPD